MIKKSIKDYNFNIKDSINFIINKKETNNNFVSNVEFKPPKNKLKELIKEPKIHFYDDEFLESSDEETIQYNNDDSIQYSNNNSIQFSNDQSIINRYTIFGTIIYYYIIKYIYQ